MPEPAGSIGRAPAAASSAASRRSWATNTLWRGRLDDTGDSRGAQAAHVRGARPCEAPELATANVRRRAGEDPHLSQHRSSSDAFAGMQDDVRAPVPLTSPEAVRLALQNPAAH